MQIGAFAALCGTKLSVLRHYDKEGLLLPAFLDPITGYRYYTADQVVTFHRITALKQAGFSLAEIRRILSFREGDAAMHALLDAKEAQLRSMLSGLARVRETVMEKTEKTVGFQMTFTEETGEFRACSAYFDAAEADARKREMDGALCGQQYQRISAYRILRDTTDGTVRLSCAVLRLGDTATAVFEDIDLPFADDPLVVGRWEIIGEYAHRDDVPAIPVSEDSCEGVLGGCAKSLYFLPGGEWYWCYGWTRGKLLCRYGDGAFACDYTTERIDGQRYMFVEWKSYEYRRGGKPTVLVLRQSDTKAYTGDMLAKKDNIDMPFADDPRVIGAWTAVGMAASPDAYDPTAPARKKLFFSRVVFGAGGDVESVYGDRVIGGADMQVWTRGYVLRKWNSTACAYEIRKICGAEYLFVEWKSGDYIWGGREPMYYVFVRDSVTS